MLNKNQKVFCQEYIKNGMNATRAYIKVYKLKDENKAAASASRLLRNVNVQEYLKELQSKLEDKAIITVEEILKELKAIAFVDRTDITKIQNNVLLKKEDGTEYLEPQIIFEETKKLSPEQKKIIAGYKKTNSGFAIETYDKLKALELLGKYVGLFNDKQDINVNVNIEDYLKKVEDKDEY